MQLVGEFFSPKKGIELYAAREYKARGAVNVPPSQLQQNMLHCPLPQQGVGWPSSRHVLRSNGRLQQSADTQAVRPNWTKMIEWSCIFADLGGQCDEFIDDFYGRDSGLRCSEGSELIG